MTTTLEPSLTGVVERLPSARPAVTRRPFGSWRGRLVAGLIASVIVGGVLVSVALVDGDAGGDLVGVLRLVGRDLLHLRWQFAAVVVGLGSLHYVAAAFAARAASGLRLPLGETVLAQLAASTADRLTPGGLGAAAVNTRYLSRRGLTLPAALGAVASLHLLGPVTDAALLALLVFAGSAVGLAGGAHEVGRLAGSVTQPLTSLASPWTLGVVGAAIALAVCRRFQCSRRTARPCRDWSTFWRPIRDLLRHPGRLATLALASGGTTFLLAIAFAASVAMVPAARPAAGLGALMVAFMIGAAAGTALPIPGGIGTTEAALITALAGLHVPLAAAVQQVLIFRVITFWLPALIGIPTARTLRRRNAL